MKWDELPNAIRPYLSVDTRKKHSGSQKQQQHFPEAIFEATDKHLYSRVEIGEELSTAYIENTIRACIDVWNECIVDFNEIITKDNMDKIRPLEDQAEDAADDESAQLSAIQKNMRTLLQPVDVSIHPEAIKKLGSYIPSSIIYIYIYIYTICPDPGPYIYIYI